MRGRAAGAAGASPAVLVSFDEDVATSLWRGAAALAFRRF